MLPHRNFFRCKCLSLSPCTYHYLHETIVQWTISGTLVILCDISETLNGTLYILSDT